MAISFSNEVECLSAFLKARGFELIRRTNGSDFIVRYVGFGAKNRCQYCGTSRRLDDDFRCVACGGPL